MDDLNALVATASKGRWSKKKVTDWYADHDWLVGANFIPASAGNSIEMWQDDTFDKKRIEKELGWAEDIGMNTMRVFLHNLPWTHEHKKYLKNIHTYLKIAKRHKISTMFVLFDSCWYPFPFPGKQLPPEPGVHNATWVQCPGVPALRDEKKFDELEDYVTGLISQFRDDERVIAWDLWNEPDNNNHMSRGIRDIADKGPVVTPLLAKTFKWARAANPSQPLTSGVWAGEWGSDSKLKPWERVQLEGSDIISFHRYADGVATKKSVEELERYGRPIVCTEYMARGPINSTFDSVLPMFKEKKIGAYNWGFVAGRTQTYYPWDSWQTPYSPDPDLWFHDIFRKNGEPYRKEEVKLIKSLTK